VPDNHRYLAIDEGASGHMVMMMNKPQEPPALRVEAKSSSYW
jgi:hypothetical protein